MGPKKSKSLSSNKKSNNQVQQPFVPKNNNVEKENFKFISQEYSKYLKCPLCKQLMIRPQRFHPCGHTFCLNCVGHLIDISKKFCPLQTCLSKCQRIQKDRTAESLIDELKVACTNTGCQWKGEYDNYKKTHKESCPLKDMGLDKYLQELRRIPIMARSSIEFESKESQKLDQDQIMIQSEHLVRNNYEQEDISQNRFEQIKQQQSNQIENFQPQQPGEYNNQIILEKQQVNDQQQKKQKQPQKNQCQNQKQIDIYQKKEAINTEQREKDQAVDISKDFQPIQLEVNHSRRINNNSFILNLPFGPSFQARIGIEQSKRQNYISKQLKKLQ